MGTFASLLAVLRLSLVSLRGDGGWAQSLGLGVSGLRVWMHGAAPASNKARKETFTECKVRRDAEVRPALP